MRLPNFFIIGAPKAGTTAMSEYLRSHPQVFFSIPKEPHYFNDDFSFRHTVSFCEYLNYFSDVETRHKAVGEGSIFYLSSRTAVSNILKMVNHPKFIVMLRDPIDIVYSWHAQAIHSFGETVMSFEEAWNLQERRMKGYSIPIINNVREALQYGNLAKLGGQVQRLLKIVSQHDVQFVVYDDFKEDTRKQYLKVLDFLELDFWSPQFFDRINSSKGYKSLLLKKMVDVAPYIKRRLCIRKNLNLGLLGKMKTWNTTFQERSPLGESFKKHLRVYFCEDVKLLSRLVGRDLFTEWGFSK